MENSDRETTKKAIAENYCDICDYQSSRTADFKKHIQSMKHIKRVEEKDNKNQERQYVCDMCDYVTDRKGNYTTHIKSQKHLDKVNAEEMSKFECQHCNKVYSGTNNLWKHMKICKEKKEEGDEEEDADGPKLDMKFMFMEFMKVIHKSEAFQQVLIAQNEEYKQHMMEMSKQQQTNISNTISNNNSNNTTYTQFNLQVFLNEQCKDALNIMDFIDSLDIQLSDLEETGKLGFIDGITRIIVNGLNKLDLYKRPIHCTDLKREILYLKDKNTWEKEGDGKPLLKKAVNRVSNMNFRQLRKWQELHPGYDIVDTKQNDDYIHLSTQAIGCCSSQENDRNMDKIMKKLCKEVVLDKKDGAMCNVR